MRAPTLFLAAVLTLAQAPAADTLRIYVIDVEGGGATLVVSPSGQSVLIDSGSPGPAAERDSKRIADAMQAAGLTRIDYLFTTHYDSDHVGGAPAANAVAHFARFFDHGEMDPKWEQNRGIEERYKAYVDIAAGKRTIVKPADTIPFGSARVDVVASQGAVITRAINGGGAANPFCANAEAKDPNTTENSQTAGVLVSLGAFTFVDVGDLTWDKEMNLACPENKLGRVSLLLATHHGFFNDQSGAPALLWAMQPQVVIANNGPRKGMAPAAFDRIQKVNGLEGLWQSHLALASDAGHNTNPDMIANEEASADCKGHWIRVDARADGSFTVTNGRNGFTKMYQARGAARNPAAAQADAAAGQRLYDQTCQACHGPGGQGDRGPALNRTAFAHGGSDADLFRAIRTGFTGTEMPAFPRLTDDQTWQIVAFIRSLSAAPAAARPAAPPTTVTVSASDGRDISGTRLNEDTFTVQLADESGAVYLYDKTSREVRRVAPVAVPAERLVKSAAEPHNWLMYWGNYQSTHYSPLTDINAGNVQRLRAAWTFPMPGDSMLETTPLVVDGVMYTTQPGAVFALDAASGRQLWKYARPQKIKNPYEINPFNRGAAILGNRLYVGTLDAALVALDARTGRLLWETQVADAMLGYSITSPPLAVKDKVLVGIAGGEFGARGFLDAYDAATGTRIWRWYAVPDPGEFGNDTWKGDSWKLGGGPTWLTGSYDPELNLVYWTVGNPGPQIDRSTRGDLDNLFSDSVVAIDPETGQRKWHYQFTPNDGHDWDSCQAVVLVDRPWHGQQRRLMLHADRNGMFYVLDRTNGAFLGATPFVYQNWNAGFDAHGRPSVVPGSNSSREGSFFVYPTVGGATNFQAPSYSPITGWLYLEYREAGQAYASVPATYDAGREYIGRAAPSAAARPKAGEPPASAGIKALDPETGKTMWDFKMFQGSLTNGVLATAGNVVFGAMRDGNLVALDATSGKHLWHFQTNANPMAASPMSYAVGGRQFVAVAAGTVVYAFALP